MKKFFKLLFINGMNLLIFYQLVKNVLSTEIELLSPNKWILYLVGLTFFIIWIFLCSWKIQKLNMYVYIVSFVLCSGVITCFSQNIVRYQDEINIEKALNYFNIKKNAGEKVGSIGYWLGLSNHRFLFQENDNAVITLIFKTTQGNFHKYYFKDKVWVVAD